MINFKKLCPTRNQGNKNVIRLSIRCLWKIQKKKDPFYRPGEKSKGFAQVFFGRFYQFA